RELEDRRTQREAKQVAVVVGVGLLNLVQGRLLELDPEPIDLLRRRPGFGAGRRSFCRRGPGPIGLRPSTSRTSAIFRSRRGGRFAQKAELELTATHVPDGLRPELPSVKASI